MKTVLVTGANSGMGLVTSIELANRGYYVVMACRDTERGRIALEEARKQSGSSHLELRKLDLASLESIRNFAMLFRNSFNSLDVLVNNAGVLAVKRMVTTDGFESMMGVNHLGHFLLTNLLLDPLRNAQQGRIVTVSSSAHKSGSINFDDPHLIRKYSIVKGYAQSKLANILFTLMLSERLNGSNVTANCLDPGPVSTNIGVSRSNRFWGELFHSILKPFVSNPIKGAQTAIYLATSSEVDRVTGQYFHKQKISKPSAAARDKRLASELWEWSEREVGLRNT